MKQLVLLFLFAGFNSVNAQQKFTVYFDTDKDVANTESARDFAQWLAANKDAEVTEVSGHADTVGKRDYNLDLSARRNNNVVAQMAKNGIDLKAARVVPNGEAESSSDDKAKDRRVDVYYNKPQPVPVPVAKAVAGPVVNELTRTVDAAKKGDKLVLPQLNFYNHSAIVLPQSEPVLSELLTIMRDNPNLKIDIQGHICCQEKEINKISTKRAKAVHDFLLKNGIKQNRLSYRGYSSKSPLYKLPEKNEEQRVANRRVEIEIIAN